MIKIKFEDGTNKDIKENNVDMVPAEGWMILRRGHKTLLAIPAHNVKYIEVE